jgi:hypothetical protein
VKLGDRLGERVEITDGVAADQPVVVADVDRFADDMKVQIARE